MKKSLLAVLCGVILGAALILGACGSNTNTSQDGTNTTATTAAAAASDAQSTLEAYLNSDVNQDGFASLNEQMESLGISMEVYADGSSIVYNYIYTDIPSTTEGIAETLEATMEDQTDTLANAVEQVESETGIDGITMVYNYIGSDGILIYSQTYSKDGIVK